MGMELSMAHCTRPTKEQIRAWLAERRQAGAPFPACEQVRRQLGWHYQASGMPSGPNQQLKGSK